MEVIPRWEWRYFSSDYDGLKRYFNGYQPVLEISSEEIYFLIDNPALNIKLRHDLIDVKKLLLVNPDGLEKWIPILKADFPIQPTHMHELFRLSELDFEEAVTGVDVEAFVASFSNLNQIEVVKISKKRSKYLVYGVSAELTKIRMEHLQFATISMENETSDLIKKAKIKLGININSNENYPAALKRYMSLK